MTRARLKALNEHLREDNDSRVERIRAKESGGATAADPPVVPAPEPEYPSHAAILADFERRRNVDPSWRRHVPDGRFCVRYRYFADRWVKVHRSATAEDRERYIASLAGGAEILGTFEAAA